MLVWMSFLSEEQKTAVIFFDTEVSANFKYLRKQGMQLHSKMRFISAQFNAFLTNELWRKNAEHANGMAQELYKRLQDVKQIQITQKVETNSINKTASG